MLKMEVQAENDCSKGVAGTLNVVFNQTLPGHADAVVIVRWNPVHSKALTVDVSGLLIVWKLNDGTWVEEFSTSRQKSAVKDARWSHDGEKLFTLHEEGEMTLITVAGRRLWSKDSSVKPISFVFSPDSKLVLIALEIGTLFIYDCLGNFLASVSDFGPLAKLGTGQITKMEWFSGDKESDDRHLVMLFQKDKLLFLRHEKDTDPVIVQVSMKVSCMKWNNSGSVLAVGGKLDLNDKSEELLLLALYNPRSQHLRSLRFSGNSLYEISWQDRDLRIALSVDSFIYIATCRCDYRWTCINNGGSDGTVVYFKPSTINRSTSGCLYFWNLRVNEIYQRTVNNMSILASNGDFCLFVSSNNGTNGKRDYVAYICDYIGTTLWIKTLDFSPQNAVFNQEKVIFLNSDGYHIHVWSFRSSGKVAFMSSGKDYVFNVDFVRLGAVAPVIDWPAPSSLQQSGNKVAAITLKDNILLLAREDAMIHQLSCRDLFHMADHYYFRDQRYPPAKFISLNIDCTKFSVIDTTGVTRVSRLDSFVFAKQMNNSVVKKSDLTSAAIPFELKDTWDFLWSADDPDCFAVVEKTKLYIYRGFEPEEPIQTSGYLHAFRKSELSLVHLDDIVNSEFPELSHLQIISGSKIAKVQAALQQDLKTAFDILLQNPDTRGWNLLAEKALLNEEYEMASKAFSQAKKYSGIKFVQRLLLIEDKRKRKAEALIWLGKLDDAEKQYIEMDRKDLAIEMWNRNAMYIQSQNIIDSMPGKNVNALPDRDMAVYHYDMHDFDNALHSLKYSKELVEVCGIQGVYEKLTQIVADCNFDDEKGVVDTAVYMLNHAGMSDSTVGYSLKFKPPEKVIEDCISVNEWSLAVELGKKYDVNIAQLIEKERVKYQNNENMLLQFLYDIQNYAKSANQLYELAKRFWNSGDAIVAKKYLVLTALSQLKSTNANQPNVDGVWTDVIHVHFYCMSQRFYLKGEFEAALDCLEMCTNARFIDNEDVHTLRFLTALKLGSLETMKDSMIQLSRAPSSSKSTNLDSLILPDNTHNNPTKYEQLLPMYNQASKQMKSANNVDSGKVMEKSRRICSVTGRPLLPTTDQTTIQCQHCKQYRLRNTDPQQTDESTCPVCHQ